MLTYNHHFRANQHTGRKKTGYEHHTNTSLCTHVGFSASKLAEIGCLGVGKLVLQLAALAAATRMNHVD